MKTILLDTNFILTSLKEKIDFFEDIKLMGLKIIIPKQVINELKTITKSKKKLHFREQSELALKLLEKNRKSWMKKDLSTYGRNTDKGIINFANKNKRIIIATLDRELKKKIKNPTLIIRAQKKLEII
jgi:rRNA-processing protein FCF1|tara:strand:- start:410 stop:793 length:384 start_codon:yes stop_codon:yes gene_type:complete